MIEKLFHKALRQEETRKALSEIRAAIKEEELYWEALEFFGNGEALGPFLLHEDAKVRKNAAALLGDLEMEEAAEELYRAYQREEKLFVKSALLWALDKTNPYPYMEELLKRYDYLRSKEVKEEEKKHIREELHALERILRKDGESGRHIFSGWNQKYAVLLTTPSNYAKLTADKIQAYKKGVTPLGVQAIVDSLREITKLRTYRELLFLVALGRDIGIEVGPKALGEALADSKLLQLLERSHEKGEAFFFRLDFKSRLTLEERSRYLRRAAAVLEEKTNRRMVNMPEDYEFEIRLYINKNGKIRAFLKMLSIPMERFSYRKQTISASIHPSLAALLLELARPYLKPNAQILDPCCGVGTMLVERHKIMPVREAYAIDIFGEAVEKGKENALAAGMDVNFIHKDYLVFRHNYPFDEIIANLPLRGKRSKEEQDAFYEGFFEKSQELLAQNGIMVLYSNENGFVKKQLRLNPCFRLYQEYLIFEKEGFYLYIIGIKK